MQPLRQFFIAFIFLALAGSAWAEDIVLIGKLEKMKLDVPGCGVFKVNSVGEYSVAKLLNGKYTHPNIKVVHSCIEFPRSGAGGTLQKFKIGDLHRLVVTLEDIHNEIDVRKRADPKFNEPLYSCIRVDLYPKWKLWLHNQWIERTAAR
jgi:hypothetical protein